MPYDRTQCLVFWGSHGCDREADHVGMHHCTSCCDTSSVDHWFAHARADENQYGADGCAGTWPYYGRKNMAGLNANLPFFEPDIEGYGFHNLPGEFDRLAALFQERV